MQNQFDPRTTGVDTIRDASAFRAPPAMRACGPTCSRFTTTWRRACC